MAKVWLHGSRESQVLGGSAMIASARQSQPEPELGVIVARTCIHDTAEVPSSCPVLARVELRSGERFQNAPGVRFGARSTLQ